LVGTEETFPENSADSQIVPTLTASFKNVISPVTTLSKPNVANESTEKY